jgi:hypothetical protein
MRGANDRRREMRKHYPEPETKEEAIRELMRARTLIEMLAEDKLALQDQLEEREKYWKRQVAITKERCRMHTDEVRKSHGLGSCAGFYGRGE